MGLSSVSFSFTTAIVYLVSGAVFFLLIFLLVMLGVTDCNCDCDRLVVFSSCDFRRYCNCYCNRLVVFFSGQFMIYCNRLATSDSVKRTYSTRTNIESIFSGAAAGARGRGNMTDMSRWTGLLWTYKFGEPST